MRRLPILVLALLLTACVNGDRSFPVVTDATSSPSASQAPSTTAGPTTGPAPPAELPTGLPPGFPDDAGPGEVPSAALVPLAGRVSGRWDVATSAGDVIVVSWRMPSEDPLQAPGGVAVWARRSWADGGDPWRPVWGESWRVSDGVLGTSAEVGDITGDGSPDAVISLATGGSGACSHVRGVDLMADATVYIRDDLCDAVVVPGDPGLVVTEAIFRSGNAHCCPSGLRTSELTYAGGLEWIVTSETETEL